MTYWCWAEIRPFDPVRQERVTVRVTSADHRRATGRGGTVWEPAMVQAPEISMRLFNGDFANAVAAGSARVPIQMGTLRDGGSVADRYFWTGAPVTLWTADAASGALGSAFFAGRVTAGQRKGEVLTLECSVDDEPFAKDVLTATYAGTGGAEGPTELKGRVKPLVIGQAKNVEPVLIDATNYVYQFSGYGAIEEVTTLYERASAFASATANYASYANLVAASIPNGRWASCLNEGLIRLGAPAYGLITGDIKGHKVGSASPRLSGAVISALATLAGVDAELIAGTTLDAMDAAAPYNINLVLRDQVEFHDIARRLTLMVNWQSGISLTGAFFAVDPTRLLGGVADLTLDAQGRAEPQVIEATEERISPPYYRTIVGANRCWRVHSPDEIAFYATITDKGQYSAATTYREGDIVSLPSGAKYLYINTTPSAGHDPPNGTYWAQIGGAVGEESNIVYKKAASQPATPSPSSGVPSGWVDDIGSVGAGDTPIWASFGVKDPAVGTYAWQTPFAISDDTRLWDALDPGGVVNPGKVDTPALVDNSVTVPGYTEASSVINFASATKTTVLSHAVTKEQGSTSALKVVFQSGFTSNDAIDGYLYIEMLSGASVVGSVVTEIEFDANGNTKFPIPWRAFFPGLAAGSYTARVSFERTSGESCSTSGIRTLEVTEQMK